MRSTSLGAHLTPARCLAGIGALSAVSAAGTVSAPALLGQPLALVLLSPRLPFLALAGATVRPGLLIPCVALRLCAGDVFHFRLGRSGGDTAVGRRLKANRLTAHRWAVSARQRLARHEVLARHSIIVGILVRPVGRHLFLAGASGACPRRVAVADAVGTLAYVIAVVMVGHAIAVI